METASASASWSQSRSRSRSRSLARRRRRRPAAYRRWWPHSDAVTGVVARGGRVVSVSEDGGCHVLPLPEDVLARAHAHLAAENRAWAARASAAARSEARTEERAHESLEASASWARTRAGGFDVFGFDGGAPRRLSSEFMSVAYRYTNLAWREGSAAAAAAAAESWRVADLLSGGAVSAAADVTYAATHAAADRAWTTGRSTGGVRGVAAASMAAETAAVAERLGREAARAAGARIVGHVGQFAPSRGLTFREHNAAAWCVAADRGDARHGGRGRERLRAVFRPAGRAEIRVAVNRTTRAKAASGSEERAWRNGRLGGCAPTAARRTSFGRVRVFRNNSIRRRHRRARRLAARNEPTRRCQLARASLPGCRSTPRDGRCG